MDIQNKHGTTYNPKSQMDIKSTAAKGTSKTNMIQYTTSNLKRTLNIT